jgi:hypothetical protein
MQLINLFGKFDFQVKCACSINLFGECYAEAMSTIRCNACVKEPEPFQCRPSVFSDGFISNMKKKECSSKRNLPRSKLKEGVDCWTRLCHASPSSVALGLGRRHDLDPKKHRTFRGGSFVVKPSATVARFLCKNRSMAGKNFAWDLRAALMKNGFR